jgi:hypothetical protein
MRAGSKRTSALRILAAVSVLGIAWTGFQLATTGHTGILRALVGVKHFLRNASIPAAAQSPRASALSGPQHSVTLSWQASTTAGVGYNVYRRDASGTVKLTAAPVAQTTYVDKTVQPGQTYYYVTKAVSAKGESIPSNEVRVTIGSP